MAQMFMPTIQTSSFEDMLTCSDEVQSSTPSITASQQLQMEANIYPTEILLYSFSSGENPHFVQAQAQWWWTKLVFPLNRTKKLRK